MHSKFPIKQKNRYAENNLVCLFYLKTDTILWGCNKFAIVKSINPKVTFQNEFRYWKFYLITIVRCCACIFSSIESEEFFPPLELKRKGAENFATSNTDRNKILARTGCGKGILLGGDGNKSTMNIFAKTEKLWKAEGRELEGFREA